MTEIAVSLPRERRPLRVLQSLIVLAGLALLAGGVLALRAPAKREHAVGPAAAVRTAAMRGAEARAAAARVAATAALQAQAATAVGADAARGFDRGLILGSPGGVLATAARVAAWKPLVVRAAHDSGISPNLLEAMMFVESSGRPHVTARDRAGLTQLTTARARSLGLQPTERFRALPELRATVRYLVRARNELGRADLAVASYHIGVRALAFAHGRPYASVYFGPAFSRLGAQRDYYWRVLAAERIMHLYRHAPGALAYEARLQTHKSSAEEVLHPRAVTPQFRTPNAILAAREHHELRAIPFDARVTHVAIAGTFGQEAYKLGRSKRLYRALRPAALDVLLYIGGRVHAIARVRKPLILTSAVRDDRYQRVLTHVNANATRAFSMHTTGYAFDIARSYANARQAHAFQAALDKLSAVDAIAYIRESSAIHVAVASDAPRKLALLRDVN